MKTFIALIAFILAIIIAGMAWAGDETEWKVAPPGTTKHHIAIQPNGVIIISNGTKDAVIDFSDDRITFEGDLPLDDAAFQFFQYVHIYFRLDCIKQMIEVKDEHIQDFVEQTYKISGCKERVFEALENVLKYTDLSTGYEQTTLEYRSPSDQLRREAERMDRRDAAIEKARKVLEECK